MVILRMPVFFIILIWLASYFSYLDLVFAVFYFCLIWKTGQELGFSFSQAPYGSIILIGFIAQFPGLLFTAASLYYYSGFSRGETMELYRFALELWHTPFLPILASFSLPLYSGYAFYYLAFFILSPLYVGILLLGYSSTDSIKKVRKQLGKIGSCI